MKLTTAASRMVWWVCMVACFTKFTVASQEEHAIVSKLLDNYDVNVRPVENISIPLYVTMALSLARINDVDETHQFLSADFSIDFSWKDESLHWDPADYGQIEKVRVFSDRIWRPDITLLNEVCEDRLLLDGAKHFLVVIRYDGHIEWNIPVNSDTSCDLDVAYYPWDSQHCQLNFTSWMYPKDLVTLQFDPLVPSDQYYKVNGEWELLGIPAENIVFPYLRKDYSVVTYTIELKRRPRFIIFHLVVPSLCIVFCTYLVFMLPPESGEKVSMSVTMLLATTVFLLMISEHLPPQSIVLPILGLHFLISIFLLVLSTAATVSVIYVHFHGTLKAILPPLGKKILLEWLAKVVFMRDKVRAVIHVTNRKETRAFQHEAGTTTVDEVPSYMFATIHHSRDPLFLEWVMAAMVLDRFFMYIFTMSTLAVTVTLTTFHRS